MHAAFRAAVFIAAIVAAFFLQSERVVSVFNVTPNLVAVFLTLSAFSGVRSSVIVSGALAVLGASFLWATFWVIPVLVLLVCLVLVRFAFRYLTGNRFLDFLAVLVAVDVLVNVVNVILAAAPFPFVTVLIEVGYTAIVGAASWFFVRFAARRRYFDYHGSF